MDNLLFRVLKKLGILNYINVSKKIFFDNCQVNIPVINGLGYPNIFLKPSWIHWLINEFFTSDGDVFIDVGANIGQTLISVKAAKRKVRYIGFDPSSSCIYYLKLLIKKNNYFECRVYNFSLADQLKENFLETNAEADPTGSLIQNLRPSFFQNRESIFSLAYDNLKLNEKVTCVKIDVEGGELEVLLGMQELLKYNRPYIICEILDSFSNEVISFTQERANLVYDILHKNNYSTIQIVQDDNNQIVTYNQINNIKIKQWTTKSLLLNDYIFYPSERSDFVINTLNKVCI